MILFIHGQRLLVNQAAHRNAFAKILYLLLGSLALFEILNISHYSYLSSPFTAFIFIIPRTVIIMLLSYIFKQTVIYRLLSFVAGSFPFQHCNISLDSLVQALERVLDLLLRQLVFLQQTFHQHFLVQRIQSLNRLQL